MTLVAGRELRGTGEWSRSVPLLGPLAESPALSFRMSHAQLLSLPKPATGMSLQVVKDDNSF